jgi:hypothetical protein
MRKIEFLGWAFLVSFFVSGCGKNTDEQLQKDAALMASLECEARHLKDERFKVANDIRLMEDSLAKQKIALTALQSREIDSVTNVYTLRTGALADKITKTMDSLFAASYQTAPQRQALDEATEKKLQEVCK